MKNIENIGLYIHIPFCKSKCGYCDFFRTTNLDLIDKYVDALISELTFLSIQNKYFRTIYVGGGTPSVLPLDVFKKLLQSLSLLFDIDKTKEFTVECNPEDVNEQLMKMLYDNGVNRISMGVQSFNDYMLRFMNRRHNSQKVYKSIEIVQKVGIENVSIDMIFGLPIIEKYSFETDVDKFVNIGIQHLSAYLLSYENGSYFSFLLKNKKLHTPSDDKIAQQYEYLTQKMTEKKYLHYEISNYCKQKENTISEVNGFEQLNENYFNSKHNSACWQRIPYYGIGAGAYSFDGEKRWNNVANINEYIALKNNIEKIREYEYLTNHDVYNEVIMLSLRTCFGVNEKSISEEYKAYFRKKTSELLAEKMLYKLPNGSFAIPESEWFLLDLITEKMML